MILFAIEEFTARRRTTQRDIEDRLRPVVAHGVDLNEDTHGWNELLLEVDDIYSSQVFEESGRRGYRLPGNWRQDMLRTLRKTTAPRTEATVDRITAWLATSIISLATVTAAQVDEAELFLEWVDMHDSDVRPAHHEANGQVQPLGEKFKVGGAEMRYPGDPTVDIALWINCRCTLHPVLAEEALVASTEPPTDPMAERPGIGGYPITDCASLKDAIQAVGRARPADRARTIAHIKTQKKNLGCPDVTLPEHWARGDDMPPTKKKPGDMIEEPTDEEFPPEPDDGLQDGEEEDPKKKPYGVSSGNSDGPVPWHAVFAPEDIWSGDKRKFAEGALSNRPLPLPLTWQKVSAAGHDGNVTVAKTERIGKVKHPTEGHYEQRAAGHFIMNTEADEVVGLIGEFGKFGLSVDADDTTYELDEDEEGVVYSLSRTCSACIVPIPAFHQAWIMLGDPPVDFFDGADDYQAVGMDEPMAPTDAGGADPEEALVASAVFDLASLFTMPLGEVFKDLAPGITEDGPGWLTHPVDTDRLRDYWVRGPGAAKIGWGTPGDFNRCRLQLGKYVKPQYLAGYCANRHFDALGFWPGRPVAAEVDAVRRRHHGARGHRPGPGAEPRRLRRPHRTRRMVQRPRLHPRRPATRAGQGRHLGLPGHRHRRRRGVRAHRQVGGVPHRLLRGVRHRTPLGHQLRPLPRRGRAPRRRHDCLHRADHGRRRARRRAHVHADGEGVLRLHLHRRRRRRRRGRPVRDLVPRLDPARHLQGHGDRAPRVGALG